MENELPCIVDEGRPSRRGRLMDKLFGAKDKKPSESAAQAALDAFLQTSANKLDVTHAPPPPPPSSLPKLAKLDTTISRYPQALAVNQQAQSIRPLAPGPSDFRVSAAPPRPNRKGLVVRFTDSLPDIIGEGGDDSDAPVIEIRRNKLVRLPSRSIRQSSTASPARHANPPASAQTAMAEDGFRPKPLTRTPTGYSSLYSPEPEPGMESEPALGSDVNPLSPSKRGRASREAIVPNRTSSARLAVSSGRRHDDRKSFIEIHQAQMRQAEGKAFAQAARTANSTASRHDSREGSWSFASVPNYSPNPLPHDSPSPEAELRPATIEYSPAASIDSEWSSAYASSGPTPTTMTMPNPRRPLPGDASPSTPSLAAQMASARRPEASDGPGGGTLGTFVSRTRHLFELFRLHAETVKPLSNCEPAECVRAGLWWFIRGRMGLEQAIRGRPSSPRSQMQNELDRQQAYSNLAKGYWLCEEVIPDISPSRRHSSGSDVTAAAQGLVSALRKLAMSMERNGFLPPEEPFLPQTIDKSIWLEYPTLSHDLLALLSGNWESGLTAVQRLTPTPDLLDVFPLGDSSDKFNYGRVAADTFLTEQGRIAQKLYLPCLLSVVRPQTQPGIVFVLASQNGSVHLEIQENQSSGPSWDDVRWRSETCTLDLRLPRGFVLVIQLSQADYRTVWNMYDFGTKVRATLHARADERVLFRNKLRAFQYIESDPPSRAFPKEAVPNCEVSLLEKVHKENGPAGVRTWHRGYRIAVLTGPRTRAMNGVHHNFPPQLPLQFGFFRAEGDRPALSIKYESGRQRGRMVLVFGDEKERAKFHALVTGMALSRGERVLADVPMKSFALAQSLREPAGVAPFGQMAWKVARVINEEVEAGGEHPPTVLADKLKVVLEHQNGAVTDRVNVAPGELRIRLEVSNVLALRVLRQPQQDVTLSVSEGQTSTELPKPLAEALQLMQTSPTIRTYEFNSLRNLHDFEAALTGFEVIFDALAATFAISRRRMVVPIHKKWEAGYTRIQVIRLADKQLQLLAFFEDFQHGRCMNFVLKGTDVYETFHRGGRSGVKFVDAKFPLPGPGADKAGAPEETAFVCLDLPDLPGEHDDISVMFEKEQDRDWLCQCLPAPAKGSSRLSARFK